MAQQWSRRGFFGVAAAGLIAAGLPAACARTEDDEDDPGKPVTIRHLFGETVIDGPPARVVSAGYTGQDDLLAVGVVPVGVTYWFGDQPFAVWPWARTQLGAAEPAVLTLDAGIDVDAVAALEPDLIVATNAGVDADTYAALSEVAPTVPQSGPDAFFEPWRDQAATIGRAVFAGERMRGIIDGVDARFASVAEAHPQFRDRTVMLLDGRLERGEVVAAQGWRTEFLTAMGLRVADRLGEFGDGVRAVIPRDRIRQVLDTADVVIWTTDSEPDADALRADPEIAAVHTPQVFTPPELSGAIAFASPLSYPVVADQLPPLLIDAL
ncbi:ABC transporter substrate-binding protein [Mycolicibacillus trivialis]|uniref:Iron ABC transporter substrate-binding protein n=1 Tax=Mycolicibacillus trivialis TaxID=1798 RepID=A0A1X2EFG0_9MYCO|nr:ABC transporter substrate-binding protein [Mycolicibacillus trivialis]ORX00155.1 iron ABC transporter substrate-binding protein [Mycolicibacillus trivialis]